MTMMGIVCGLNFRVAAAQVAIDPAAVIEAVATEAQLQSDLNIAFSFPVCHRPVRGRIWRITCVKLVMFALPIPIRMVPVSLNSCAMMIWNMPLRSWTIHASGHTRYAPNFFGISKCEELLWWKSFLQGEVAYVRVREDAGEDSRRSSRR